MIMTTQEIQIIASKLNNKVERLNGAPPYGTCHLLAHLMVKHLELRKIKARTVTGHLMLLDKNEKKFYYSNKNPSNKRNVGYYHTWCEADINDERILIDPSLKYNIAFLKKFRIKINAKIPEVLVTNKFSSYYYRYSEDEKLKKLSDIELLNIPASVKEKFEIQI